VGRRLRRPSDRGGKAKIASEDAIVIDTARAVTEQSLEDTHVVVTSGATTESIDPVRTLSNRASGKTGRAVARACYLRGADVTLVHDGSDVPYAGVRDVESAAEMTDVVTDLGQEADALVSAAAISDYTAEGATEKIPSGQDRLTLELEPTPKLIDAVREAHPDLPYRRVQGRDRRRRGPPRRARPRNTGRADLAFVVANDATVMGEDGTSALVVDGEDVREYEGSKDGLGARIADELVAELI